MVTTIFKNLTIIKPFLQCYKLYVSLRQNELFNSAKLSFKKIFHVSDFLEGLVTQKSLQKTCLTIM